MQVDLSGQDAATAGEPSYLVEDREISVYPPPCFEIHFIFLVVAIFF